MAEDSLISEELKSRIGVEGKPRVYEIEKGLIKQFAQAIDDPNPLWQDEEYARKSKYGGLIAPPALVIALGWSDFQADGPRARAGLHGGTDLEYYQPIRAGDTITITNTLIDAQEKDSRRLGKMAVFTYERTYKNQRQEVVAKCRQLVINYRAEGVKHD